MNKYQKICLVGGEDAHKRIGLSRTLMTYGHSVTIIGTKKYNYPDDIKFIKYNLHRRLNIIADIGTIISLRKIFKKNDFDIIQTFDTKPAFLVPLAFSNKGGKIVRTITGLGTIFMSNAPKYRMLRLVYKLLHWSVKIRIAHTTFQNENDQNYFLKNNLVEQKKSSLIFGSGIELDKYNLQKQKTKHFTFICIGRLVYEKGILNYLQAAKICHNRGHNYRFLLVGPLEEDSKRLNVEVLKNYEENVEWLGQRNDIPELLSKSDVFVLPTFREGFSRVLLEASAIGIPSITTNVPGTREIIRNNKEGLLINVNDSGGLADAMINIASDARKYKMFAKNAKNHVNQFGLGQISDAYAKLYQSII